VSGLQRKVVLVTRKTRLEDLVARYHTLAQVRFYLEHLGADLADYLAEHGAYQRSLDTVTGTLVDWGRYQVIDRRHLTNFLFAPDDIVVALGQDGLVANTLKYLDGQPLLGLNPEPSRWDGVLLPFVPRDLGALLPEVAQDRRPAQAITMAEVRLSDGQVLRAVNEVFVGQRGHASALYDIELDGQREQQSSSGVIVATGLGSGAWLKSVLTGAQAVVEDRMPFQLEAPQGLPWDAPTLQFVVREPFPSRSSQVGLVHGTVSASQPLRLRSRMPDQGVVFSDGMEDDFLRFTAGMEACVTLAGTQGRLVQ
jgi:NAD kinase